MRRKTIQLAGKTLVVSLPASWTKMYGVRKGEEVEVSSHGSSLVIEPVKREKGPVSKVDVAGLNASLVWHAIVWRYVAGHYEMEVRFKDSLIMDPRSGKRVSPSDVVEQVVDGLIGMEIVRHARNMVTIREVSQSSPDEYQNVVRRAWLTVLAMAEDGVQAIRAGDQEGIMASMRVERNVNRLVLYALRMLNQGVGVNVQTALADSRLLHALEGAGDMLFGLPNGGRMQGILDGLFKAAKALRSSYECWFSPSNEAIDRMYADLIEARKHRESYPFMVSAVENLVEAVAAGMAVHQQEAS